jgi:hypothetical protein
MDKRFMVLLHTSFLREENPPDETVGLSPYGPFQLVHPSLNHQRNAFMGCDCHIELVFKAWKSHLHLATLPTKTVNSTLCYLYGRMLLILLTFAFYPTLRATVWITKRRELSLLKLIRHLQALADRWLHLLFAPASALCSFLRRAYTTAERLVLKAVRKRRTTVQLLRDSLASQHDFFKPARALAA